MFDTNSIRDWKHSYGIWLITESIDIIQNLNEFDRLPEYIKNNDELCQSNNTR